MTLLGIAVLGKSNEPLYLCDCQKCIETGNESLMETASVVDDPFGFVEHGKKFGMARSLSLDSQFLVHSALDVLEEKLGKSKPDGTMPLRRGVEGVAPISTRWTGKLLEEGDRIVFGHLTATNIKLLALCQHPCKESSVKNFLAKLHNHYISYVMNPILPINTFFENGIIQSKDFDRNVRIAVQEYHNVNVPLL
ncbi:predicted protein [Phaeodactylum tricornutum CCAP 1055/1]|jgi:hypothetical protein|uniref:Trafficking protein particle complex subunit 2-like protein n=1 Tax=Phaeodactylum tricornutum (strain CCAP 1055/1) TaxID=556484 RepID=B7G310_PHATC|nr:predicted protein [Phaeodactylum tricornutum CCAP 1055/1]EEC46921.1 predicted protein [Phaeodactylum tricornutum CCAP 1055/1]|eukprot:XP_002181707.1 predicted protein [Phaeodactylum tricornutum CCAP 1055/1]